MSKTLWTTAFRDEIIDLVIKPKLITILRQGVESKTHLIELFNETFSVSVSSSTMNEWLKATNLNTLFSATRFVQLPAPTPTPTPGPTPSPALSPSSPDPDTDPTELTEAPSAAPQDPSNLRIHPSEIYQGPPTTDLGTFQ